MVTPSGHREMPKDSNDGPNVPGSKQQSKDARTPQVSKSGPKMYGRRIPIDGKGGGTPKGSNSGPNL